jgi:hypothetical protein
MARSDVILRAAILKESKASLHGELLESEGEGYDESCGECNFCIAGSFLFEERSITVVPFCLQFLARLRAWMVGL